MAKLLCTINKNFVFYLAKTNNGIKNKFAATVEKSVHSSFSDLAKRSVLRRYYSYNRHYTSNSLLSKSYTVNYKYKIYAAIKLIFIFISEYA